MHEKLFNTVSCTCVTNLLMLTKHFDCSNCAYVCFMAPEDSPDFGCPMCKKRYCMQCKVEWHKGSTCEEYQKWSLENGLADEFTGDYLKKVAGTTMQKCPRCNNWIEKSEGCNHMTCKCGHEFDFATGKSYNRNSLYGQGRDQPQGGDAEDYSDEDEEDDDDY